MKKWNSVPPVGITSEKAIITAVARAFGVLEAFRPERPKLTFQQLVKITQLPKTTVHRLIGTLFQLGYLVFDPESRKYCLSPKIMLLGFTVLSNWDVREIARPYMEQLSQESDQNVNLGVLVGSEVVYIERIKRCLVVNIEFSVGSRLDCYNTAIGRAIVAFLDIEKRKTVFEEFQKDPKAVKFIGRDGQKLRDILAEVREVGFAIDNEEWVPGVVAIAAPIFNVEGLIEGAINMIFFSNMVDHEELTGRYIPMLRSSAARISTAMGFQSDISLQNR